MLRSTSHVPRNRYAVDAATTLGHHQLWRSKFLCARLSASQTPLVLLVPNQARAPSLGYMPSQAKAEFGSLRTYLTEAVYGSMRA